MKKLQNNLSNRDQQIEDGQYFLQEGQWIIINYQNYYLYSQGFKTSQLSLRKIYDSNPISLIFIVESFGREELGYRKASKFIYYGEKILLQHLLSGKYLSYSLHSSEQQVRLKYGKTGNCLFTIKPIFKCQANFGRRIRIEQQVCFQSIERLKLYIELGVKQDQSAECFVTMRKHESSILLLDRLNTLNRQQQLISSLKVYQLVNVQQESSIQAIKDKQDNYQVTFSQNTNIYGSFLTIESFHQLTSLKQSIISFKQEIVLRFYTNQLYIGFNNSNQIQLFPQKNDSCKFILQSYDDNKLMELSVLKIRHVNSNLYFSIGKQFLQEFSLKNTFKLSRVQHNMLKVTLLVNEIYCSFGALFKQNVILRYKAQFQQLSGQLIRFIFPPSFSQEEYFGMKINLKLKITSVEQSLLAKVGFISLLSKTISEFIGYLSSNTTQGKFFYQESISYCMIIIMGICYKNKQNTEELISYLPLIYEGLPQNPGIIQALYYIFSDQRNLQILEKAEHKSKKNKIRSIQLLIEIINKHRNWQDNIKQKLLKLLQRLVLTPQKQKMLIHQFSLIRALKSKKLDNIIIQTKITDDQIEVRLHEGYIQLSDFLQKKVKYYKEINCIRSQLHFLCTLYSNPSISNLQYFRSIFPEQVLQNYLKMKISAEDRQILLRILSEIYLSSLRSFQSNIIIISKIQQMQASNIRSQDHKILQKMKDIIVANFKQSIQNQLIDSALHLHIKVIRRYYEIGILEEGNWQKIKASMQKYLQNNYDSIDKQKQVKELTKQILESYQFSEDILIEQSAKKMIKSIKNQVERTKDDHLDTKIQHLFTLSIQESFSEQQTKYAFLSNLIQYSVDKESQIFIRSCLLMKKINQRPYRLLEKLKSLIILEGDWIENLVQEIKLKHQQLKDLLAEYLKKQKKEDIETLGLSLSLIKNIKELNHFFTRWKDDEQKQLISPLIQNIFRQMQIHMTIIMYIRDEQRQLRTNKQNKVFYQMFQFLIFFFYNNFTNLQICIKEFNMARWPYAFEDVGQSKLLYLLVRNRYSEKLLEKQMIATSILTIKNCQNPNCYGLMSVICLIFNNKQINFEIIQFVTENILNQSFLVNNLLKISQGGFIFQCQDQQKQNYCEYFGYYMFLVIKLCMIMIEFSNKQDEVIQTLKKNMNIKLLLQLLITKDLIDVTNIKNFGVHLMKEEIIGYLNKVYDLEHFQYKNLQYLTNFSFQFSNLLLACNQQSIPQFPEISNREDVYSIQIQCYQIKNNYVYHQHNQTFLLAYITTFYPFLLTLSQKIYAKSISSQIKAEIESIWLVSFGKICQILPFLMMNTYLNHKKRYNQAILLIQDIIKQKLNFEIVEEEELAIKNVKLENPINRIYRCQKLHNLIDNCEILGQINQVSTVIKVYKAIFQLLYSPSIHKILLNTVKSINPLRKEESLWKISDSLRKAFEQRLISGKQGLELFWQFAQNSKYLMQFILSTQNNKFIYIKEFLLSSQEQDYFNELLGKFLNISNKMMTILLESNNVLNSNIFQENRVKKEVNKQAVKKLHLKLMNVLKMERKRYQNHFFEEHLLQYQWSNARINYQKQHRAFQIESVLDYLSNKLSIVNSKQKSNYLELINEVLLLLRTYVKFLTEFKLLYIPKELQSKIILCLQVIFHANEASNQAVIQLLLEGSYYKQFEIILNLDDSWYICQRQKGMTIQNKMLTISQKLQGQQKDWVLNVAKIISKSVKFYGHHITYAWALFPLQSVYSLYGPLKKQVIQILKELKISNTRESNQFLLGIPEKIIFTNIKDIYIKHHKLCSRYGFFSVNPQLRSNKDAHNYQIGLTLCFENGVDLTSIVLFTEKLRSKGEINELFVKHWESHHRFAGFISEIDTFLSDLSLYLGAGKQKLVYPSQQYKIYEYFYSKIGSVEVISQQKLYCIDFMIRPQCMVHSAQKQSFISNINFISTQVKLSSILQQSERLGIIFDFYSKFMFRFQNFRIVLFLQKYLSIIRILNYLLILMNNIYLLYYSNNNEQSFYKNFQIHQPFEIILLLNLIITFIYFVLYNIRNIPIIIDQIQNSEKRQIDRGQIEAEQKTKKLIILKAIFLDKQIIYNFVFLIIMLLSLVNKLLVAILLLDILFQIKTMRLVLNSLWQAKSQLLYSFISFLLIHYFYTIITFLTYEREDNKFCKDIGQCYGFVFNLCYKVIGGFPGYLYQKAYLAGNYQANFHLFNVLEDIYLIVTFQIFYAVILVIIIDSYSKGTRKLAERRQNLSIHCLICGLSRTIFNTSARLNFRTHISVNHNVWNYANYFQYLKKKSNREKTKFEKLIVIENRTQWLPNGYASGFTEPISHVQS